MTNYEPWEILYLPGKDNVVADALSRKNRPSPEDSPKPRKNCRIEHCEVCDYHFKKNNRCRDSDSPDDSSEEMEVVINAVRTRRRYKRAISDPTDDDDFTLWDLQLIRADNASTVLTYLAQTRGQTCKELEESRQPLRRSERIAGRMPPPRVTTKQVHKRNWPRKSKKVVVHDEMCDLPHTEKEASKQIGNSKNVGAVAKKPATKPPLVKPTKTRRQDPRSSVSPSAGDTSDIVDKDSMGKGQEPSESKSSELLENEVTSTLHQLLNQYSDADWIIAQDSDPALRRVKALRATHKERPELPEVKSDSQEVRDILKDWYSLEMDRDILCRRVLKDQHSTCDPGTLQRFVPSTWRMSIWRHMHGVECRHFSAPKIYEMLSRSYCWPGMSSDVQDWNRACLTCQKSKEGIGRGSEPMRQDFTSRRNERVAIDLVGILPCTAQNNQWILVMQDYYTKWVEIAAMRDKQAANVAQAMLASWIVHWGCPEILHSDQGNEFEAEVFKGVCRAMGITKTRTTPFNPSSNGMVERTNRTIKSLLRAMANESYMTTWDVKLPLVMIAINNTIHRTTGYAPFRLQVVGNENMRVPADFMFGKPNPLNYHCYADFVFQLEFAMKEIHERVRLNMEKEMNLQKEAKDNRRLRTRKYKIGDLCLRYYPPWASQKLHPFKYQGPYKIVDTDMEGLKVKLQNVPQRGRGRYQDMWIHVSALKPVIRTKCGALLELLEDGSWREIRETGSSDQVSPVNFCVPAITNFTCPSEREVYQLTGEVDILSVDTWTCEDVL